VATRQRRNAEEKHQNTNVKCQKPFFAKGGQRTLRSPERGGRTKIRQHRGNEIIGGIREGKKRRDKKTAGEGGVPRCAMGGRG